MNMRGASDFYAFLQLMSQPEALEEIKVAVADLAAKQARLDASRADLERREHSLRNDFDFVVNEKPRVEAGIVRIHDETARLEKLSIELSEREEHIRQRQEQLDADVANFNIRINKKEDELFQREQEVNALRTQLNEQQVNLAMREDRLRDALNPESV